jgi:hypothetical protein
LLAIVGLVWLSLLTDTWRPTHVLLLAAVVILPAVMGIASFISDLIAPRYSWNPHPAYYALSDAAFGGLSFVPHAALSNAYPNLETAWSGSIAVYRISAYNRSLYSGSQRALCIFNKPEPPGGLLWQILGYLATGLAWWFAAVVSLDMVRRPQKYLSWRPWRKRPQASGTGTP